MHGDRTMNCYAIDNAGKTDSFGLINYEMLGNFKAPHPHDILIKLKSWRALQ